MSEKTEKPTEKKIKDARKKGQVAKSVEITSGIQLAAVLAYFTFEGQHLLQSFEVMIHAAIDASGHDIATALEQVTRVFAAIIMRFVVGIAVLVITVTVVAIIGQIGPMLASEAMQPSLDKINPLGNFKQMFSIKSLFELTKSILKVLLLSLIFVYLIRQYGPSIQFLSLCDVSCGMQVSIQLLYWMWAALIGFYVIFGIADLAFQRYNTTKQLMMSMDDIKQEFKNSEGNQEIKQKRKEVHREIQSGSLAANVAKSTVVVRNPTHVAVCLYYKEGETPLPQLLEMGRDEVALHIVRLAEKNGIPVVENITVARALAAQFEVGRVIPSELFEPVAHILRIAMNLNYEDGNDEN